MHGKAGYVSDCGIGGFEVEPAIGHRASSRASANLPCWALPFSAFPVSAFFPASFITAVRFALVLSRIFSAAVTEAMCSDRSIAVSAVAA